MNENNPINFFVDNRENKLKLLFDNNKDIDVNIINIKYDNLIIGDFKIELKDKIYIFERKSIDDLLKSVIDGRYKTQKTIALSQYSKEQYFYIIEGYHKWNDFSQNDKIISGAIINTILIDKISILYSKDYEDTYKLLINILNRIIKNYAKYNLYTSSLCEIEPIKTRTKNLSINNCFIYQLSQIPDVSIKTAEVIVQKYKNMRNFIKELSILSKEDLYKNLEELKIGKRKISSKSINSIIYYMFHDNQEFEK